MSVMDESDRERKLVEAEYSARKALKILSGGDEDDSFELAKAKEHLEHAAKRVGEVEENV